MRNYIILFFSVLSFLYACNGGVPGGVLPPDKMTAVLHDVYLADGRVSIIQQIPDTLYKYATGRYLAIFKKFGTDSAQFRKSYLYYCTQPDQLLAMNAKILKQLMPKGDSLRKLLTKRQIAERKRSAVPVSTTRSMSSFHPTGAGYGAGITPPAAMPAAVSTAHPISPVQHSKAKQDTPYIHHH